MWTAGSRKLLKFERPSALHTTARHILLDQTPMHIESSHARLAPSGREHTC